MEEEVCTKLSKLTEEEKIQLCEGDLVVEHSCSITMKIFNRLFEIAENCSTNRNQALKKMLPCLNGDFDGEDIKIQNVVRRYR